MYETLEFKWERPALLEMLGELDYLNNDNNFNNLFPMNVLVTKLPRDIEAYYTGDNSLNFNRHISGLACEVQCERCQTKAVTKWLSRTAVAGGSIFYQPVECKTCRDAYVKNLKESIRYKWANLLDAAEATFESLPPLSVSVIEHKNLAKKFFKGNLEFHESGWTWLRGFSNLAEEILSGFFSINISHEHAVSISIRELEIEQVSESEHSKLFIDWAMTAIKDAGARLKREFKFSLSYEEDLRELVAKASYYHISFAIYAAEIKAEGSYKVMGHVKDVTFKSHLTKTLDCLARGEWNLKPGACFYAERDCPDSFWELVRLREHGLSKPEIFSTPLGQLAALIEADISANSEPESEPTPEQPPALD